MHDRMNVRISKDEQAILPTGTLLHRYTGHLKVRTIQSSLLTRFQNLFLPAFQLTDAHPAFHQGRPGIKFLGISLYIELRSQNFHLLPLAFDNNRLIFTMSDYKIDRKSVV